MTLRETRVSVGVSATDIGATLGLSKEAYLALEESPELADNPMREVIADMLGTVPSEIEWVAPKMMTLKETRESKSISVEMAAKFLGISVKGYKALEEYPDELMSIELVEQVCLLLGVKSSEIEWINHKE